MTGKSGPSDPIVVEDDSPNGVRGKKKKGTKKGPDADDDDHYDAEGNWVGPNAKKGGKPMNKRGPNGEHLKLDEHGNYIDIEADKSKGDHRSGGAVNNKRTGGSTTPG